MDQNGAPVDQNEGPVVPSRGLAGLVVALGAPEARPMAAVARVALLAVLVDLVGPVVAIAAKPGDRPHQTWRGEASTRVDTTTSRSTTTTTG